jgi:hypothetical protein
VTLDLDPTVVAVVALAGLAVAVLALLLLLVALVKLRRLRRSYGVLQGTEDKESMVAVVERQIGAVAELRSDVSRTNAEVQQLRVDLADAIRHVAVVRYDAFNDMGGRMSFSAALLDDAGDGLVISSINGRSETRTYAKGVKGGSSDASLSPEEEQAIGFAREA